MTVYKTIAENENEICVVVNVQKKKNKLKKIIELDHVERVFIGKSPLDTNRDEHFDGNSILIHISDNSYVFVQDTIFLFKALAPIVEFVSPVGNSDVPYAYAVDKKKNVYLLKEKVVLLHCRGEKDPYDFYYDTSIITSGSFATGSKFSFQGIVNYFVGDDEYVLRYKPFADKWYDREKKDGSVAIVKQNGNKIVLSKKAFVEIMEAFAKEKGFLDLQHKMIADQTVWKSSTV